jgi:NADH-quinone oxidoreductase subunit H
MSPLLLAAYMLLFPGIMFLIGLALFAEWYDRKLMARLQNRMGPPLIQPFADFIKLMSKEDIVPEGVPARLYAAFPIFAFAAVATAFLYIPILGPSSPFGFPGDLILVLYLLTLPTILLFLIGWTSRNVFAQIGSVRAVSQLFVYEVPFFLAALGPALAADTWSLAEVVASQATGLWLVIMQPLGFAVLLIALQAKLERVPFDIPEAETEIVAGPVTELTGRKLAIWQLTHDMAMVTGAALTVALFLGGPTLPGLSVSGLMGSALAFAAFLGKLLLVLFLLAVMQAAIGRLRIDQLMEWGWKIMAPLALTQIAVVLVLKAGGLL